MKINIRKRSWYALFLVILSVYMIGCNEEFDRSQFDVDEENMLIYDYVSSQEHLSIYTKLCDYTGFYGQVSTAGSYTVFIPTDSAFLALFKDLKIDKIEDKEPDYWLHYLRYHALEMKINTNTFQTGQLKEHTMMGEDYFLTVDISSFQAIKVNEKATIREYNIDTKNGYANVIDMVLVPPINSIYEALELHGGYSKMLSLFIEHGFESYLKDSLVTVLIEPNEVFEQHPEFSLDKIENIKEWLSYHIIPGNKYFISSMDARSLQPLYKKDVITFNYRHDLMWCNQKDKLSNRAKYGTDNNCLNGIYHAMGSPLHIREHTAGTVETNLYGRSNETKGYKQNVFAEVPALVYENLLQNSYHQNPEEPEPPICLFRPVQAGDAFNIEVPNVVPGVYAVRLIYYKYGNPKLTLLYENKVIQREVDLSKEDGDFAEYTSLKYKDLGFIEVNEKSDVALRFSIATAIQISIDRIDLVPQIEF